VRATWSETLRVSGRIFSFRSVARLALVASAGPMATAQTSAAPRSLSVARVAGVRLDGRLDDAAWRAADSAFDFRQREPVEGAAATERTVVRVLRDDDALYVAVRAYDRAPGEIRATQLRRDADLSSDDNMTLLFDSFHDRRTAFVFQTNPNGAMWDAQVNGLENSNSNWNGIWEVATSRDSSGWIAEFRIPFSTLRFDAGANATFGFNVERRIRRKNEQVLWSAWRRNEGLYQLVAEGELAGLGSLERRRNVELKPYLLGRSVAAEHDVTGVRTSDTFAAGKAGIDAKTLLLPTLTADLSVNTDFAQVEVDRQVINLTRFPTFFPEKRDFFLEGSGIFDFGSSSRAQLFYSRRIGLREGAPVPILAGARVTGRQGPWTIGALDARTGGADQANDAVLRLKHDVLARSYVGGILVSRTGPGVDSSDYAAGVDAQLPLLVHDRNVVPAFWIAGTQRAGAGATPLAWRLSADYPNDLFDNFVSLYRIDAAFGPTLGFVRRTGIWETTGHIDYMPRPGVLGIRHLDLTPIPTWDIIADDSAGGAFANTRLWQTASFEWQLFDGSLQSGDEFGVSVTRFMDAPHDDFEVFRDVTIGAGRYWWTRGSLSFETSPGRPLSVGVSSNFGTFYDGRATDLSVSTTWRGGGHVILGAEYSRSDARLRAGRFVAVQTAGRVEYALSTRTDFLAFVQYNNEDARADFNLRFHWIPRIGDDVYVVWNSGYSTDPEARVRFPSRRALSYPLNGALVVKAVHRIVP